jgi:hypothetical protein
MVVIKNNKGSKPARVAARVVRAVLAIGLAITAPPYVLSTDITITTTTRGDHNNINHGSAVQAIHNQHQSNNENDTVDCTLFQVETQFQAQIQFQPNDIQDEGENDYDCLNNKRCLLRKNINGDMSTHAVAGERTTHRTTSFHCLHQNATGHYQGMLPLLEDHDINIVKEDALADSHSNGNKGSPNNYKNTRELLDQYTIISGSTKLMGAKKTTTSHGHGGVTLSHDSQVVVDSTEEDGESKREKTDGEKRRRRLTTTTVGERSVLVLRVSTSDSQVTLDAASIADSVFGALVSDDGEDPGVFMNFWNTLFGITSSIPDPVNLASQFDKCSNGKLLFRPHAGSDIVKGVAEVALSRNATNAESVDVMNDAMTRGYAMGLPLDDVDHVMVCVPPGTSGGGWIAYAYLGHSISVYNDVWCTYMR